LHHNVLAIALANKLARIAWAVLAKGRAFELTRTDDAGVRPARACDRDVAALLRCLEPDLTQRRKRCRIDLFEICLEIGSCSFDQR
jgi:hypothetical protein